MVLRQIYKSCGTTSNFQEIVCAHPHKDEAVEAAASRITALFHFYITETVCLGKNIANGTFSLANGSPLTLFVTLLYPTSEVRPSFCNFIYLINLFTCIFMI